MVLTANEFDAMATYQATQIPALALPNSYYSLSPEVCSYNYIAILFLRMCWGLCIKPFYKRIYVVVTTIGAVW